MLDNGSRGNCYKKGCFFRAPRKIFCNVFYDDVNSSSMVSTRCTTDLTNGACQRKDSDMKASALLRVCKKEKKVSAAT